MKFKANDSWSRLAPPAGCSQCLATQAMQSFAEQNICQRHHVSTMSRVASHTSFSLTAEHRQFAIANRKTSVMRSTD